MDATLKTLLYAISIAALVTGANVLVGGSAAVPGALEVVEATVDNELRFFSVYWMAFGMFCFWVARNLASRMAFLPAIALIFFLSGVARLISILTIGRPSDVLIGAMVLEFVLPAVLYLLYINSANKQLPVHDDGASAGLQN